MIKRVLLSVVMASLAGCGAPRDRAPMWISLESQLGASFDFTEHGGRTLFSIGCSKGIAQVSVAAFRLSEETSDVVVRLSGVDTHFAQIDRDVPRIVAQTALTAAWIDAVAQSEAVSITYAGQNFGPLELPAEVRAPYAENCREILTNPERFL